MTESFNLLRRVRSLDIAPELAGYSGVVIFAGQDDDGNNIEYRAGDRTGTVLEITNEWGSQAQADAIYRKILGFKYQTYKAGSTSIDPSAEIGDAVTVADIHSGVFAKKTTFGRHIRTDLEAPSKEEVEHEFQIQSSTNRQYERFTRSVRASLAITATKIAAEVEDRQAADNTLRATLNIHAQEIEAKVSKEGGNSSSFGWKLTATGWSVYGNGSEIFGVNRSGAYVNGEIRSKTGKIGNWDINSNYLSYNGQTWGGTNTTGAYIGQSGIQFGKNFKVDMQGNLTAASGTFSGKVKAGNIEYGGSNGTLSGSALTGGSVSGGSGGAIAGRTLSTYNMTGGVNTSLGYADYANGVFNGWNTATWFKGTYVNCRYLTVNEESVAPMKITFATPSGGSRSLWVLGRTIL